MRDNSQAQLIREINSIEFSDSRVELCAAMDKLFQLLSLAQNDDVDVQVFITKIRSGIMRLRAINSFQEADHYENELGRMEVDIEKKEKKSNRILIYSFVGLALIAVFGSYILEKDFRLYKKVLDYFVHLFE